MASSAPRVTLLYGNQRHSVEQAAEKLISTTIAPDQREFACHRFDAAELLAPGAADAMRQGVDEFQLACQTVPFFSETYLVQLNHLERVKLPGRAAQNVTRALEELLVRRTSWEGQPVWATEEDLPPGGTPEGGEVAALRWVKQVAPLSGGGVMLDLQESAPDFLLAQGDQRRREGLKGFLKNKLKGSIHFSDETAESGQGQESASAGGRLHQLLEKLVVNPPPGCILLFTASASRESELSPPLLKLIKKHGKVEKFVTYDDYLPIDWLLKEARGHGLALSRPAAEQMIHLVGNDLGQLAGELEKLALLVPLPSAGGQPRALDEQALLATLHANSRYSLFAITEQLGNKKLDGALLVLEQFLVNSPNEHPLLTGILARYFRQLHLVHTLRQAGGGEAELAAHLKLPPFIARKIQAQARGFSIEELEAILQALAQLDYALRQSHRLAPVLLKNLVMEVCSGAFKKQGRRLPYRIKAGIN